MIERPQHQSAGKLRQDRRHSEEYHQAGHQHDGPPLRVWELLTRFAPRRHDVSAGFVQRARYLSRLRLRGAGQAKREKGTSLGACGLSRAGRNESEGHYCTPMMSGEIATQIEDSSRRAAERCYE